MISLISQQGLEPSKCYVMFYIFLIIYKYMYIYIYVCKKKLHLTIKTEHVGMGRPLGAPVWTDKMGQCFMLKRSILCGDNRAHYHQLLPKKNLATS